MEYEKLNWDLIINSKKNNFQLGLGKIWKYRDLLSLLVRRDFIAFYKQTIFGPLWFFIQPLFTTLTFTIIFSGLAGLSTDGIPPVLFYLSGITCWSYFSESLLKTSSVLRDNASIFGKVYFPRIIVPISIVVSNLIKLGIQFSLLLILLIYFSFTSFNYHLSLYTLLFPFVILILASLALSLGLIVSSITVKYRDFAFLLSFSIQLLMYATPVIYPLSSIPDQNQWIFLLNPMSQVIELARLCLVGKGYFSWYAFCYIFSLTIILLVIGILVFNKSEKNFIDII